MQIQTLMAEMAEAIRAADIKGIAGVSYPARNDVPDAAWVMVRQAQDGPATYSTGRFGEQIVTAGVDCLVLVPSSPDAPQDQAMLDGLIEPIVDVFDTQSTKRRVSDIVNDPRSQIDHIGNEVTVIRSAVEWSGEYCYAARITFDTQFRRRPGEDAR